MNEKGTLRTNSRKILKENFIKRIRNKHLNNKETIYRLDKMIEKIKEISVTYALKNNLKIIVRKDLDFMIPMVKIFINNRIFLTLLYYENSIKLIKSYKRKPDFYFDSYFTNEEEVYENINNEFLAREKRNKRSK